MSTAPINHVTVVGRDAALWLTACALQTALSPAGVQVTVVELPSVLRSPDFYATLPALEALHTRLGIDEAELLASTGGSFSLGQNFTDVSHASQSFFHAYGAYGAPVEQKPFLPHWLLARRFGLQVALEDFSLTAAAAKHGRMLIPDAATQTYGRTDYAYHLPAIEYVHALKRHAIRRSVTLHAANHFSVVLNPDDGAIVAVALDDERRVDGQLYVDATGAQAQLMGAALGVQRENWREFFPADRVLRASTPRFASIPPYAEVRACREGWLGLYPNQARTHIAQVYASAGCSDGEALHVATQVSGLNLQDAVVRTLQPSRSAVAWHRNCVAIGEAACVFDPAHCVDLQAVQIGLVHLLSLFPVRDNCAVERVEYNRTLQLAFERLRDFQSAHYVLNRHSHSSFWSLAREASVSPLLRHKIETFRARGDVPLYEHETFPLESWQALFLADGVTPETHDPMVDSTSPEQMKQEFRRILGFIKDKVQQQTPHDAYLRTLCARRSAS